MEEFKKRLSSIIGNASQTEVAATIGITQTRWGRICRGKTYPDAEVIKSFCTAYKVDPTWLLFGEERTPLKKELKTTDSVPLSVTSIPVKGLASCGLKDWFSPESIAMRVMLPFDVKSDNAIAVIAIGNSMIPLGIRSGNIAICDTSAKIEKGDIIYVLRKDGSASIKVFIERDEKWLHVQGWLPPNETGGQKPYIEKCLLDIIELTAPVVYVRVKA